MTLEEIRDRYNRGFTRTTHAESLEETGVLLGEIDRLTPQWQEGLPPQGVVWREGESLPVKVEGSRWFRFIDLNSRPWGSARWAFIQSPS